MKLKIVSVHGHGDYDEEYVMLKAIENCDIGDYVLADSTYLDSELVSNKLRHMFWIPDKEIKSGDFVAVWTKKGKQTVGSTTGGETLHRYFWGLDTAVWNDAGDVAVLLEISDRQFFRAK